MTGRLTRERDPLYDSILARDGVAMGTGSEILDWRRKQIGAAP